MKRLKWIPDPIRSFSSVETHMLKAMELSLSLSSRLGHHFFNVNFSYLKLKLMAVMAQWHFPCQVILLWHRFFLLSFVPLWKAHAGIGLFCVPLLESVLKKDKVAKKSAVLFLVTLFNHIAVHHKTWCACGTSQTVQVEHESNLFFEITIQEKAFCCLLSFSMLLPL